MIIDHKLLMSIWEDYGLGPSARWAYTALVFELFNAFSRDGVITPSIAAKAISHRQLRSKLLKELASAGLTQRVGDVLLLSHFKNLTAEPRVRRSVTTRLSKCHHSIARCAVKTSLNRALRQEDFTSQAHSGFQPLCVLVHTHTCASPKRASARWASAGLGMVWKWLCETQEGVEKPFSKANRLNVAGDLRNEVYEPLESTDIDEGKLTQASAAISTAVEREVMVHPDSHTDSPKATADGITDSQSDDGGRRKGNSLNGNSLNGNNLNGNNLNGNNNRQRFSAQRPRV